MNKRLKTILEDHPQARERKHRYHVIRKVMVERHPMLGEISKETMLQICRDMVKLDRDLRKVQQDNPHLRGTDYQDKHELEAIKRQELGYGNQRKKEREYLGKQTKQLA